MEIILTDPFKKDYEKLPKQIQIRTDKQLKFLLENPYYPSLSIKKIRGETDIWKGRISKDYRFTFKISGDKFIIRRIGHHSITKTP